MTTRDDKGRWPPGQSGNPGGRPANRGPIIEYADEFTAEAVEALVAIMRDKEASRRDKLDAANAIMDRGRGKATQHSETVVSKGDGLDELLDQIDGKTGPLRAVS